MRKLAGALLIAVLAAAGAQAQEEGSLKVLTEAVSVRENPEGQFVETVGKGEVLPLNNLFEFWGKGEKGWVNTDYGDYNFPLWKRTGQIELQVAEVVEPAGELKPGDAVIVVKEKRDRVIGLWRNQPVEVGKESVAVRKEEFEIVVPNFPVELKDDEGMVVEVKAGTPLLKGYESFLYNGHFWDEAERVKEERVVNREELLKEINRLIDIFNSVKLSSPLSERLGYFVKTLPVRSEDLQIVETPTGTGAFVKVRYQFVTKDGRVIEGRKTRFFLKKSNYEFWRKLTEEAFNSGLNKFFEIDVYRFDGKGGFEKGGFVASSYHLFKEGKLKDWKSFLENSESNLSEDLWFFADEVYERLEGGGED